MPDDDKQHPNGHNPDAKIRAVQPGENVAPGECATMVAVADYGGEKFVALRAETPVGMIVLMFDPEHAESVSARRHAAAGEARSGLTIVGG